MYKGWGVIGLVALVCNAMVVLAEPSMRVALMSDGCDATVGGFVDQVEVQLSKRSGIELLDRANIQRVWDEQSRAVEVVVFDRMALTVGRLLTADVLVAVTARGDYVAWRVLNVSDGRLLCLDVQKWPPGAREEALAAAEAGILKGLTKARAVATGSQYVSVARFVNEDVSRRNDSLEEALPELLSAILSAEPSLIVVERAELMKIEEELVRTKGASGNYRGGTFLIDGTLRDRSEGGRKAIAITIAAGRPGSPSAIRFEVEREGGDLLGTAQCLASRLLSEMGLASSCTSAVPPIADEAESYYRKGNFYGSQDALGSAVKMYEIASALLPANDVYRSAAETTRIAAFERRLLAPDDMLTYYIREANAYAFAFNAENAGISKCRQSIEQGYPAWLKTYIYLRPVAYRSPYGDLKRRACEAYFSSIHAIVAWYRSRKLTIPKVLCESLSAAVLQSGLEMDEGTVRKNVRLLVDLRCAKGDLDWLYTELYQMAGHRIVMEDVPRETVNLWVDSILDELSCDERPMVKFVANLVLNRAQSAVNELALWPDDAGIDVRSVCRSLRVVLLKDKPGNPRPIVDAIRQALKVPGAKYTAGLDALTREVFAAEAWHKGAVDSIDGSGTTLEAFQARMGAPHAPHEWSDVLVLHLSYAYAAGDKPYVEELAGRVLAAETTTNMSTDARACVETVSRFLKERSLPISPVAPPVVPAAAVPPAPSTVPMCNVLWDVDVNQLVDAKWESVGSALALDGDVGRLVLCYGYGVEDAKLGRRVRHCKVEVRTFDPRNGEFQTNVVQKEVDRAPGVSVVAACGSVLWIRAGSGNLLYTPEAGLQPLSSETGLPDDQMTSSAFCRGRYFVGCRGGFGEWFPKERRFAMIASTRVADERQPLSGGALYSVAGMGADESRERLVLVVAGGGRDGLWEHSLTNGAQRRLLSFVPDYENVGSCRADARCLSVSFQGGAPYTYMYDLVTPEKSAVLGEKAMWYQYARSSDPEDRYRIGYGPAADAWPAAGWDGNYVYSKGVVFADGIFVRPGNNSAESRIRLLDNGGTAHDRVGALMSCRYGFLFLAGGRVGLMPFIDAEPAEWMRTHPLRQPPAPPKSREEVEKELYSEVSVY